MRKKIMKIPFWVLSFFLLMTSLGSCVKDDELSITEPTRYTNADVKSYADLFKIFWTVMDQRYAYFYEQKKTGGMDWNAVYHEYYPKFAALKTFGRSTENDGDIDADQKKAQKYFEEIINPIMDVHFYVKISMPVSNNGIIGTYTFEGNARKKVGAANKYYFDLKYNYMKDKLAEGSLLSESELLAGNLKSNPDIYYFSFAEFSLAKNWKINLKDRYLSPDPGNSSLLTVADIEKSTKLNEIKDVNLRTKVKNFTIGILNQWNAFPASDEVKTFKDQLAIFKTSEIISDAFIETTKKALTKSKNLIAYNKEKTYGDLLTNESGAYIEWFVGKMNNHVNYGYVFPHFQNSAMEIISRAPFYKKFLNPLHKGDFKKIIIDLRSNGGGMLIDARFFSDRFITQNKIWGYQRTKEGNGQFNYTPWVPTYANPHQFGIPSNIPIAILTDKGSVSMAEITTMMLKSQGNQVVSIGDYTAGGTAGLSSDLDEFNGGIIDKVTGYLQFYMPLMAFKNADGQVIEGIGVKPDIYVTPPTDAEINTMKNSPSAFIDRVMNEAIKYISSK
ncbi:peptidase S41 [Chryseobacterium sp. Tr-659]|uniref:S41 family peptidase n=1 Tax=Chryseobacterium sp. Tr-659 TaxID=2608340 RepID=UPI00141EA8A4|nr:S41 family peptidase [Chryseobacterium sp. Tr-659]NIF06687.1 peptidase S41 [Chryseobacterium sp. Tr-659]